MKHCKDKLTLNGICFYRQLSGISGWGGMKTPSDDTVFYKNNFGLYYRLIQENL